MLWHAGLILAVFVAASTPANVNYGQHIPQGKAAVDFLYSARGNWRETIAELKYVWNHYGWNGTPNHPVNANALRSAANGTETHTARDANGHLLCDVNNDLELSQEEAAACTAGFHMHGGLTTNGATRETPFTLFLLDENMIAQLMAKTYGTPEPAGVVDHPAEFMRWKIMSGESNGWTPYGSDFFDTLALDGIYYLATSNGRDDNAITKWNRLLLKTLPQWNSTEKAWRYPQMHENYWYGLFRILTEWLMTRRDFMSQDYVNRLLQHSVSLRFQILNSQEKDSQGVPLGWVFERNYASTMNTEGVAIGSLALGVNSKFTFEADSAPMVAGENTVHRYPHTVSVVAGESAAGIMSSGPNIPLSPGSYIIQFVLRVNVPVDDLAVVDVFDSTDSKVITSATVDAKNFYIREEWNIVELHATIEDEGHTYEFRTHWNGVSNLDIAYVRVQ